MSSGTGELRRCHVRWDGTEYLGSLKTWLLT